jgi:hypothetical protein
MAHDVFISHSTRDRAAADAICAALEARGIRCWVAPRDIVAGESWPAAIIRGIRATRIFVLVFSPEANVSKPVQNEVVQAADLKKHIICFGVEKVEPEAMEDDLRFFLATRHWLDVFDEPLVTRLDRLGDVCAEVLATERDQPAPVRAPGPAPSAAARPGGPPPSAAGRGGRRRSRRVGLIAAAAVAVAAATAVAVEVLRPASKPAAAASSVAAPPVTTAAAATGTSPVAAAPATTDTSPVTTADASATTADSPTTAGSSTTSGSTTPAAPITVDPNSIAARDAQHQIGATYGGYSPAAFMTAIGNYKLDVVTLYLQSGMTAKTAYGGWSVLLWGFQSGTETGQTYDPVALLKAFQAYGFNVDDQLEDAGLLGQRTANIFPLEFPSPLAPKGYTGGTQGGKFVGSLLFWIVQRALGSDVTNTDDQAIQYLVSQGADCEVPMAFMQLHQTFLADKPAYDKLNSLMQGCAKK